MTKTKYSVYDGEKRVYFSSEEEFSRYTSEQRALEIREPTFFGLLIFFSTAWFVMALTFQHYNIELGKNIKFCCNLAVASGLGYVGYVYGRRIFYVLLIIAMASLALAILWMIAAYLYKIA